MDIALSIGVEGKGRGQPMADVCLHSQELWKHEMVGILGNVLLKDRGGDCRAFRIMQERRRGIGKRGNSGREQCTAYLVPVVWVPRDGEGRD